ncbi:MAG: 50S ribosomal protein L18 [Planctomycetes bacterium]|nr:50S ribosomal protein L18 [Planctomycetota bacterium]
MSLSIRNDVMDRKQKDVKRKRARVAQGVRRRLKGLSDKPRLTVFRSNRHFYCQAIDDELGKTLATVSSQSPENRGIEGKNRTEKVEALGVMMAERLKGLGIERAVFDRNWYRYHGVVKSFADAVRKGGIKF